MTNISTLTDKDLLALCQKYGTQTILWRRKFIGLLPEVDRRKLYEKKKCVSIYEFAAKFGGISCEQVKRVLSVDEALEKNGLTELRGKLINGAVSVNKLARVVSVANEENEKILVEAAVKLSQSSLETFVKDERNHQLAELLGGTVERNISEEFSDWRLLPEMGNPCEDTFVRHRLGGTSAHKQDYEMNVVAEQVDGGCIGANGDHVKIASGGMSEFAGLRDLQLLGLDERTVERLKELKNRGHDINEILKEMLDKREEEIEERKWEISGEVMAREEERRENGKEPSRYVSVKTKGILKEEFGTKCAVDVCEKEAVHLHHAVPFSIGKSNSPDLMKPLCRAHHDIVHSVNMAYLNKKGMS